jgi:hypothetical protein
VSLDLHLNLFALKLESKNKKYKHKILSKKMEKPLSIIVKDLNGKSYTINNLRKSMKVSEMIEKVCEKVSSSSNSSVMLIHRGQPINKEANDASKTLESIDVEDGATLMLIYRLVG